MSWNKIDDWMPLIRDSVSLKARVVARDPNDTGTRKTLNFGHTLGHAFESLAMKNYPPGILHGDAIASGMIGELFISWHKGHICWTEMVEVTRFLKTTFPRLPFTGKEMTSLFNIILKDKKNHSMEVRISTLKKIGEPIWDIDCDREVLEKGIDYVLKDR
jgi:3-dehydroquinate synthase